MITVLRIGHRAGRDPRISTHCALVARAFSADSMIYTGEHDSEFENSVKRIISQWGGDFKLSYEKSWRKVLSGWKGKRVHLTMYGLPLDKEIKKIRKLKDVLVIIGGQKVPIEVYHSSDYNISVTSQPHSEVAALSVFLHEYLQGSYSNKKFRGARIKVIPRKEGKATRLK